MVLTVEAPVEYTVEIPVQVVSSDDGGFVASNDDLAIAALGATESEAVASFERSVHDLVRYCVSRRLPLPATLRR